MYTCFLAQRWQVGTSNFSNCSIRSCKIESNISLFKSIVHSPLICPNIYKTKRFHTKKKKLSRKEKTFYTKKMGENYNYWKSREWMYKRIDKRIDKRTNNISDEFSARVEEFMNFASSQPLAQSSGGKFYCPCSLCKNDKFLTGRKIWNYLYSRGFMSKLSLVYAWGTIEY